MMTPKQVLEQWIEAFNNADIEKLVSLYHDDAINHQVANPPVIGKSNIEKMFKDEFSQAEMTCIPINFVCEGDWAVMEWTDPLDMKGCGFFNIIEGKIKLQRGYWDKLTFLKLHNLPLPSKE